MNKNGEITFVVIPFFLTARQTRVASYFNILTCVILLQIKKTDNDGQILFLDVTINKQCRFHFDKFP